MESASASPPEIVPAILGSGDDATVPGQNGAQPPELPRVLVPIRIKITLPYALLAVVFALAATYVASRLVLESIEDRFKNQLVGTGKLTADLMVAEENRLLETFRLLAFVQGMPEAMVARNSEQLRNLAFPIAANSGEEAVEILDMHGASLLSMRRRAGSNVEDYSFSQGGETYIQWEFVRNVLEGRADRDQNDLQRDKYSGLARAPWGDYFYVSGPVLDVSGQRVGAILVGTSLPALTEEIRSETQAITTIYDLDGQPIASSTSLLVGEADLTGEQVRQVLARQEGGSLTREVTVASVNYREILGPWEARGGADLGLIGASLAPNFITRASRVTRIQIFLLVMVAFLLVLAVGVYLANRITRPILQMVDASSEVAHGNLDVKVDLASNDEVAVLAQSFNNMVFGLREGSLYRDLLGRTVSPEVREQLRENFASGDLRLEGQETVATVLMSDIRGFTALAEKVAPTTILTWLNEYFGEVVPIITHHGGVVNRFDGDAVLAFFGILPHPLPPEQSAGSACQAAVEMLKAIELFNARRAARGEPPFVAGIGINTGPVTAGGLGSADRLHYTIIGDTVNTTQRLESSTRQFERASIIVSVNTACRLRQGGDEFHLEPLGAHTFKGKAGELLIYRLWPCKAAVEDQPGNDAGR